MPPEKMTIVLAETGTLTAGLLECAHVMRALTRTRETMETSLLKIINTRKRLTAHMARYRAALAAQKKRLARQQRELRRQIKRLKGLKP
jgi:septal ring factor EnvC (AmiA/AmiB activator)